MVCCMQRFRWTPSSVFCVFEQFFKEFPRYCNVNVSKSSFTSNFQKTMRRLSFCSCVILIVVILAFVVQDAYLLSPWGRRFGRSATKKHRNERIRQVHYNERDETSHTKDEALLLAAGTLRNVVVCDLIVSSKLWMNDESFGLKL